MKKQVRSGEVIYNNKETALNFLSAVHLPSIFKNVWSYNSLLPHVIYDDLKSELVVLKGEMLHDYIDILRNYNYDFYTSHNVAEDCYNYLAESYHDMRYDMSRQTVRVTPKGTNYLIATESEYVPVALIGGDDYIYEYSRYLTLLRELKGEELDVSSDTMYSLYRLDTSYNIIHVFSRSTLLSLCNRINEVQEGLQWLAEHVANALHFYDAISEFKDRPLLANRYKEYFKLLLEIKYYNMKSELDDDTLEDYASINNVALYRENMIEVVKSLQDTVKTVKNTLYEELSKCLITDSTIKSYDCLPFIDIANSNGTISSVPIRGLDGIPVRSTKLRYSYLSDRDIISQNLPILRNTYYPFSNNANVSIQNMCMVSEDAETGELLVLGVFVTNKPEEYRKSLLNGNVLTKDTTFLYRGDLDDMYLRMEDEDQYMFLNNGSFKIKVRTLIKIRYTLQRFKRRQTCLTIPDNNLERFIERRTHPKPNKLVQTTLGKIHYTNMIKYG